MSFYLREFGIPEDKKVELQNQLIKQSYNENAASRQAAVWALGKMNVHRQDAYLTVVRRLVDTDTGTREEAKRVLKTLTGIIREDEKSSRPGSKLKTFKFQQKNQFRSLKF